MSDLSAISLPRRLLLAGLSLTLSAACFRGQVCSALVTRGDSYLQRGDAATARAYYARALAFDDRSPVATDRFAFAAFLERTPHAIGIAVEQTTVALKRSPNDLSLLHDRALLFQFQRKYRLAQLDFLRLAMLTNDPRFYHFAGWDAIRSGNRAGAIKSWRAALAADERFTPAREALRREHVPVQ